MADRTFTIEEKYLAALRETKLRERVYARMVANGRMKQEQADYGIAVMKAIAADYQPTGKLL